MDSVQAITFGTVIVIVHGLGDFDQFLQDFSKSQ